MYPYDHEPAHFHAYYGEEEVQIRIDNLGVFRGSMTQRQLAKVLEWAELHRADLEENWRLARSGKRPNPIAPLK